ncbi:MAG: hypothetical protein IPK66_09140 [Rhodospirillales bacterium]|nr:hypothetical protein [Rhodospirillales bacterium]
MPKLTRDRVVSIVGKSRLDDHAIAEIIRTEANELDLVEAISRVTRGSSDVGAERRKPISRTVVLLCDILAVAGFDLSEPD